MEHQAEGSGMRLGVESSQGKPGHKPVNYFVTGKSPGDLSYKGTHEATVGQK